jgi:hypothetical protein
LIAIACHVGRGLRNGDRARPLVDAIVERLTDERLAQKKNLSIWHVEQGNRRAGVKDEKENLGADAAVVDGSMATSADPSAIARHTPGPWNIKRAEIRVDGEYDYAIYDASQQVIAETFGRSSASVFPPAEANAHLIAAAPELYEVLADLWLWASEKRTHLETDPVPDGLGATVLAALAKAEGK